MGKKEKLSDLRTKVEMQKLAIANLKERNKLNKELRELKREQRYGGILETARGVRQGVGQGFKYAERYGSRFDPSQVLVRGRPEINISAKQPQQLKVAVKRRKVRYQPIRRVKYRTRRVRYQPVRRLRQPIRKARRAKIHTKKPTQSYNSGYDFGGLDWGY